MDSPIDSPDAFLEKKVVEQENYDFRSSKAPPGIVAKKTYRHMFGFGHGIMRWHILCPVSPIILQCHCIDHHFVCILQMGLTSPGAKK